jgi:cysteine-rich repeat protein
MARAVVRALLLTSLLTSIPAARARAAVDLNGPWNVILGDPFNPGVSFFQCNVDVTQVGTSLTIDAPAGCLVVPPFTLTGTVDTATGDFSVSGTAGGFCAPGISVVGSSGGTSTAFTGTYTCASAISGSVDGSRCGNGVLDPGEVCDDGARYPGDCCSTTCTHEAAGTYCGGDADPCTYDVCDGAGTCTHPIAAGVECTSDGNPCTDDVCSDTGVCEHLPNTDPCSDGNGCTVGDACAGGACVPGACSPCCDPDDGCTPALGTGCKQPTVPTGPLKYRTAGKEELKWNWKRGEAVALGELGDPTAATDYTLCLYRNDPSADDVGLVFTAAAPAGGTCGSRPCWRSIPGKGFLYSDRAATPDGLRKIVLRAGGSGQASALVRGAGPNLRFRPVLGPQPVIAQLRAANGTCFEAGYVDAVRDVQYISGGEFAGVDFFAKKSSPSGAFID